MKKLLSVMLTVVAIFALCAPVSAAEMTGMDTVSAAQSRVIGPQWDSTSTVTFGVSINTQGYATSEVRYYTYDSTDKFYLTATLQKRSGSSYEDVVSWGAQGTGRCTLSKSRYVAHGTYRLYVIGEVYTKSGSYVETVELYSAPKTY